MKRTPKLWIPNLNVTIGAFLQRVLVTHRNTSKATVTTPVEFLLRRRLRLPSIADFELCKPILFKSNEKMKTVPATFTIRKGLNILFIQPKNWTRTFLVSNHQIGKNRFFKGLSECNIQTKYKKKRR